MWESKYGGASRGWVGVCLLQEAAGCMIGVYDLEEEHNPWIWVDIPSGGQLGRWTMNMKKSSNSTTDQSQHCASDTDGPKDDLIENSPAGYVGSLRLPAMQAASLLHLLP